MTGSGETPDPSHRPVLYSQVLHGLRIVGDGRYLDGTYGRGGHAGGVLQQLGPAGRLLVIDKDPQAIADVQQRFAGDERVRWRRGSFASLAEWDEVQVGLDGVLFDLGVSSPQLDQAERGFSFQHDGPLDMRMDPDSGQSAAQWLAQTDEQEIASVLWNYGEERMSRRIARALVARRESAPLQRTAELADLIASVVGRREPGKHPATRSFQALRIHLNRELADLETGLVAAHDALKPGGRLVVISFHSLEDRMVKRFIAERARPPAGNRRLPVAEEFTPTLLEVGRAQRADEVETRDNPRARSAVLRVAERCT